MEQHPDPGKKENRGREGLSAYSRYSTIVIQMVVIIVLTTYGGIRLDERAGTDPLFTVIFSLLGVAAALWLVIKEVMRGK